MNKKTYIYAHADEKNAKTLLLYANSSKALFYDEAAKEDKVAKADLKDLFVKGVTIAYSGDYYKPVCVKTTGLIASDGTSTALTFTGV